MSTKTEQGHAETRLFQGHADQIASSLAQAASGNTQRHKDLRTEADYFDKHKRRMQYLEFREEGFPIGSGTVESGVKQFKQRLTGTGMRWNADNANRMIVIRAAVLGTDFDALWDAA